MQIRVIGKLIVSGDRTDYVSRKKLASHEGEARTLYSKTEEGLTRRQANQILSNGEGSPQNDDLFEIVVSLDKDANTYELLGETEQARMDATRDLMREGLEGLFEDLGVKDERYIFAIHRNTDNVHAHIIIAKDVVDIKSGYSRRLNYVPDKWLTDNGLNPSRAANHFTKALLNISLPASPPSIQTKAAFLEVRQTMPLLADTRDLLGQIEFNKAANYLLHERELSPRIVDSVLSNGSVYANQHGQNVFVHRDVDGQATGCTVRDKSTTDVGHFFIGNPRTASRFILTSSPIEALSLYDLTSSRNLSKVCFVSIAGNNPQDSLLRHIVSRSKIEPVRVVWALGLDDKGTQDKEHFDDAEDRLSRFHEELGEKTVDVVSYQPKATFGDTWNRQLIHKHLSGELVAIERRAEALQALDREPIAEREATAQEVEISNEKATEWVRAIDAGIDEAATTTGRADTTNVGSVETVAAESVNISHELTYELDAAAKELSTTEFADEAIDEASTADGSLQAEEIKHAAAPSVANEPARVAMKEKTNAVRSTPLPEVMRALGLDLKHIKGEPVYADGGGRFRLKVSNDLFTNRIDSDRGGRGALDLVMYVQETDFTNARKWLVETFYKGDAPRLQTNSDAATESILPVASNEKKDLVMPPANDLRLDVVRTYLTTTRGISPDIIEAAISNGSLYANSMASAVFVHRDADGAVTGATWRATDTHWRGNAEGTDKSKGCYYVGDLRTAKTFVLTEAPIEALSYLDLHRAEDFSETTIISLAGSSVPKELLEFIGTRGHDARILFALNNDKAGEKGWQRAQEQIKEVEFNGTMERIISRAEDWNDELIAVRQTGRYLADAEHVQSEMEQSSPLPQETGVIANNEPSAQPGVGDITASPETKEDETVITNSLHPDEPVPPPAPEGWTLDSETINGSRAYFLRSDRYAIYQVGLYTNEAEEWRGEILTSRTRAGVTSWGPARKSFNGTIERVIAEAERRGKYWEERNGRTPLPEIQTPPLESTVIQGAATTQIPEPEEIVAPVVMRSLDEILKEEFKGVSDEGLIRRIEAAPDFGYDDEEAELQRRLTVRGQTWRWTEKNYANNYSQRIEVYNETEIALTPESNAPVQSEVMAARPQAVEQLYRAIKEELLTGKRVSQLLPNGNTRNLEGKNDIRLTASKEIEVYFRHNGWVKQTDVTLDKWASERNLQTVNPDIAQSLENNTDGRGQENDRADHTRIAQVPEALAPNGDGLSGEIEAEGIRSVIAGQESSGVGKQITVNGQPNGDRFANGAGERKVDVDGNRDRTGTEPSLPAGAGRVGEGDYRRVDETNDRSTASSGNGQSQQPVSNAVATIITDAERVRYDTNETAREYIDNRIEQGFTLYGKSYGKGRNSHKATYTLTNPETHRYVIVPNGAANLYAEYATRNVNTVKSTVAQVLAPHATEPKLDESQPSRNVEPLLSQTREVSNTNLQLLADEVFNGGNESLYDHLRNTRYAYTENGVLYPSNGLTKQQVIEGIAALSPEEITQFSIGENTADSPSQDSTTENTVLIEAAANVEGTDEIIERIFSNIIEQATSTQAQPKAAKTSLPAIEPIGGAAIKPSSAQVLGGRAEKSVAKLLHRLNLQEAVLAGESFHVAVKNPPYLDLIIERHNEMLYLTHYTKESGDLILNSEMVYAVSKEAGLLILRETAVQGFGREFRGRDRAFASMFAKNLLDQGFGKGQIIGLPEQIETEPPTGNGGGQLDPVSEDRARLSDTEQHSFLNNGAHIIINPSNTIGVMGAGASKAIADRWPSIAEDFKEACRPRSGMIPFQIGFIHTALTPTGEVIAHLPTKADWRNPSRIEYVEEGLKGLTKNLRDGKLAEVIKTLLQHGEKPVIAMPLLGTGKGGLNPDDVSALITERMTPVCAELGIELRVFNERGQLFAINAGALEREPTERADLIFNLGALRSDAAALAEAADYDRQLNKGTKISDGVWEEVSGNVLESVQKINGVLGRLQEKNIDGFAVIDELGGLPEAGFSDRFEVDKKNNCIVPSLELLKASQDEPQSIISKDVAEVTKGTARLANMVHDRISSGAGIKDNREFTRMSDEAFKGTRAAGTYSIKDAYDAMEAGVHAYVMENAPRLLALDPHESLTELRSLIRLLPTQADRTEEQNLFQQFSTPPTEAFVAYLATGARAGDRFLEPSGGTAGLAAWVKGAGHEIHVNEIAVRRQGILSMLGFNNVTGVDAQYLNDLLPRKIKPTVVLMNPPFSSTGGRTKNNNTHNGAEHVKDALARLPEGGRLVAIVGEGMAFGKDRFNGWWKDVFEKYNVKANISVPGEEYGKYGTTFGNQLLIIDKSGRTPGATFNEQMQSVVSISPANLEGVLDAIIPIAAERPEFTVPAANGVGIDKDDRRAGSGLESNGNEQRIEVSGAERRPLYDSKENGSTRSVESNGDSRREGTTDQSIESDRPEPGGDTKGSRGDDTDVHINETPEANEIITAQPIPDNIADETTAPSQSVTASLPVVNARIEAEDGGVSFGKNSERRQRDGEDFVQYRPTKFKGGVEHPAFIVEASSMAAVAPPDMTYTPQIDPSIVRDGLLSDLQYESVVYAGQRHEQRLPNGARAGYFCGDGTGVGKGRIQAGIALDNWNQNRKRILWLSINYDLVPSSDRDLKDLGADIPLGRADDYKPDMNISVSFGNGVMFASYATLIAQGKSGATRFNQIKEWLGDDGVIMFDEAHLAKNAVEDTMGGNTSQRAEKVVELQEGEQSNPNWRIIYASATGATDVRHMGYMVRLGLWGQGTSFPGGFPEFQMAIERGGVGAMEMVARDMKALGMYSSRSISYRGVDYKEVEHELLPEQIELYNTAASAWQMVQQEFEQGLEFTGANARGRSLARARYWSSQQLFFRQFLTAMKVPAIIAETERAIKEGSTYTDPDTGVARQLDASVVIGLIGTGESRAKDQVSKALADGRSLDELDFSPKNILIDLVQKAYPVIRYTQITDPTTGKTKSVPLLDENGVAVKSAEAEAMRDEVLHRLESLTLPENPLDQIVNYFGPDRVAEITGRNKRLVRNPDTGQNEYVKRSREGVSMDKASQDEMDAFQAGRKRVAIISQSASTGISLHADKTGLSANYRRVHLTLETGWSADVQMQTFGRTHRSNQEAAPEYGLVSTNVGGEKRFLSTVARRLASLGALTKGERKAASAGGLGKYDFENHYGEASARALVTALSVDRTWVTNYLPKNTDGETEAGINILVKMGIATKDQSSGATKLEPKRVEDLKVSTFLNRLLILDVQTQNAVFNAFADRMVQVIEDAKTNGIFDEGVSDIKGTNIRFAEEARAVSRDETTGAETFYYKILADERTYPVAMADVVSRMSPNGEPRGKSKVDGTFWQQKVSKNIIFVEEASVRTDPKTQRTIQNFYYTRPGGQSETLIEATELITKYERVTPNTEFELRGKEKIKTTVRDWWQKEYTDDLGTETTTHHLIGGAVLPVWQRLTQRDGDDRRVQLKSARVELADGERIVGIRIPTRAINGVLRDLGVERSFKSPQEIFNAVLDDNEKIKLVGGMELQRTFLKGNQAIKLTGETIYQREELKTFGLKQEIIAYSYQHFVPTDPALGIPALEKLLGRYPAVDTKAETRAAVTAAPSEAQELFEAPTGIETSSVTEAVTNRSDKTMYCVTDDKALRGFQVQEVAPGESISDVEARPGLLGESISDDKGVMLFAEMEDAQELVSRRQAERNDEPERRDYENSYSREDERSNEGYLSSLNAAATFREQTLRLKDARLAEYINDVEYEIDDHGRIKLNPAAHELLQRAYTSGGMDVSREIGAFAGVFNTPHTVNHLLMRLDTIADDFPEHREKIDTLARAIADTSDKYDGVAVFYTNEGAILHEELHRGSYMAAQGASLEARHGLFESLAYSPELFIATPILSEKYKTDNKAILVEELAAIVAAGESHKFGLTNEQGATYLSQWFESIATKNGDLSREQFKELTDESARIRDAAYERATTDREYNEQFIKFTASTQGRELTGLDGGMEGGRQGRDQEEVGRDEYAYAGLIHEQQSIIERPLFDLNAVELNEATEQAQKPFYSQLERAISERMPTRASVEQVRAIISNPKSGVKADEIKWTGFDDFLNEKAAANETITKEAALTYLDQNNVQIVEVTKGGRLSDSEVERIRTRLVELGYEIEPDMYDDNEIRLVDAKTDDYVEDSFEAAEVPDEVQKLWSLTQRDETTYGSFVMAGGGYYREVLLTLPTQGTQKQIQRGRRINELEADRQTDTDEYRKLVAEQETSAQKQEYKSPHFAESNIIAHLRLNERTDSEGKRVLFIEELQSDWHQQGRQLGYQDEAPLTALKAELRNLSAIRGRAEVFDKELERLDDKKFEIYKEENELHFVTEDSDNTASAEVLKKLSNRLTAKLDTVKENISGIETARDEWYKANADNRTQQEILTRWHELDIQIVKLEIENQKNVPAAPFSKTWHELAMKHALRFAAENGFDRLAWTTGEQQSERYDLSKQIDKLAYQKQPDGTYKVSAIKGGEGIPLNNGRLISEHELEDHVGKNVAQKITNGEGLEQNYAGNNEPRRIFKELLGVDLKVGGEGMRKFYDEILPAYMQKYGKKWGATIGTTELKITDMPNSEYANYALDHPYRQKNFPQVHAIDITPEMRRSVMLEGQPLFSLANEPANNQSVIDKAAEPLSPSTAAETVLIASASDSIILERIPLSRQLMELEARVEESRTQIASEHERLISLEAQGEEIPPEAWEDLELYTQDESNTLEDDARELLVAYGVKIEAGAKLDAMLEAGRLHAAEIEHKAGITPGTDATAPSVHSEKKFDAQPLESELTAQEQNVLVKFDEVVRIANDTYKNRSGNSELTPEIKLAIAEQAAESSLRPVVDSQIAAINHVAQVEKMETPVFENRVAASVWLVKQSDVWREQWTDTVIAEASARVESTQQQTRIDRNTIGESIASKFELIHAQHQFEAANNQENIRRYKVETPDGMRRLSVYDVRQQAIAVADRVAAQKLDATIAEEQKRPQGARRSATELHLDLHTSAIAEELSKQTNILTAIREKHTQAMTSYEKGISRAKNAEAVANLNAERIVASYEEKGAKAPASLIAPTRLDKLQDEAIARRDPATILALDEIRHTQAPNTADYSPIRSNEAAARLRAQTRLAELGHMAAEGRGRDFEATAHLRRFHVEGHDRSEYSKSDAPDKARRPNYEWSLKDVATAAREAKKNEKNYERSAQHYETRSQFSNLIKNMSKTHLNPFLHMQMQASVIYDPLKAVNMHFNPLKAIEREPIYQVGRFVFEAAGTMKKAAELRELAKIEAAKSARLEAEVRPEIVKQIDVARADMQAEVAESQELPRALNSVVAREQVLRDAVKQSMPEAIYREHEIRQVESIAMELQNGSVLKEFEEIARTGQAHGLLKNETLAARAGGREIVAAARSLDSEFKLAALNNPIGTEGLTMRGITPVKVEIEGATRVMSLHDAWDEPEAVKNIIESELTAHEERMTAQAVRSREFYDNARALASEYKAVMSDHAFEGNISNPLPQFTVKEHLEIERFAASVNDEEVHQRFSNIAKTALQDGRVLGIQATRTTAPEPELQNTVVENAAPEVEAMDNLMQPTQAALRAIQQNAGAAIEKTITSELQKTISEIMQQRASYVPPPVPDTIPLRPYTTSAPLDAIDDVVSSQTSLTEALTHAESFRDISHAGEASDQSLTAAEIATETEEMEEVIEASIEM